jgi:endogenous inhibitor of DNA gyrase (YacG/DUF329 family)
MTRSEPPAKPDGKCPICGRPSVTAYRPFCSRRCADVDLARWLRGTYAIPVADRDDDEDGSPLESDANRDEPGTKH